VTFYDDLLIFLVLTVYIPRPTNRRRGTIFPHGEGDRGDAGIEGEGGVVRARIKDADVLLHLSSDSSFNNNDIYGYR
jgi:hypothetical protein